MVVLERKNDESTRNYVDYRALEAVMTEDSYTLPRIDDVLLSDGGV